MRFCRSNPGSNHGRHPTDEVRANYEGDACLDPTEAMLEALRSLTVDAVPLFEYLLLRHLVEVIPSLAAIPPGDAVFEILGRLLAALMACGDSAVPLDEVPERTAEIDAYRAGLVAGARSFGKRGPNGFEMLVSMVVPAVEGELEASEDLDERLQGVFTWLLMALVAGFGADAPPSSAQEAIRMVLALWSEIMEPRIISNNQDDDAGPWELLDPAGGPQDEPDPDFDPDAIEDGIWAGWQAEPEAMAWNEADIVDSAPDGWESIATLTARGTPKDILFEQMYSGAVPFCRIHGGPYPELYVDLKEFRQAMRLGSDHPASAFD